MFFKEIYLQNFRRFPEFVMDFHPELTVIAARNGQGKTSVLEAIAAAMGPFVGAFDAGKGEHIRRSDARYSVVDGGYQNEQNFPVVIAAELERADEDTLQWQRRLNSPKGKTTIKEAAPLASWGRDLQSALRVRADVKLPVVCYYSSKRLWVSHKNTSTKARLTGSRTVGYEDCLSSMSSFTQLQTWMKDANYAAVQQRQRGDEDTDLQHHIRVIASAVDSVMSSEGWFGFHYSFEHQELAMSHAEHGPLPISMLSDGVRAMISLIADLALRSVRLNGHLGESATKETPGIVLIDEVDLHLHPAWQQQVLHGLRKAFPRIQFIVSTHSPQVLSTVSRENIRVVYQDAQGAWKSVCPSEEVKGLESQIALSEVMGVDPVPPLEESRWLAEYMAKIESGSHEDARANELRKQLEAIYGEAHRILRDADRLIRFQAMRHRRAREQGE